MFVRPLGARRLDVTQKTMTEKDALVAHFSREYETTLRLLKAFPAEKSELKPSEKSKTARELAWMLVLNQMVVVPTIAGDLKPGAFPPVPQTWAEIIPAIERAHILSTAKLESVSEEQLNNSLKMPSGPNKVDDKRIADALWFFFYDSIHHSGQFSVYARVAGANLQSIYGPTADEQWW